MPEGEGWFHKTAIAPERVLSPRQTVAFESLVSALNRPSSAAYSLGGPGAREGRGDTTSHRIVEVTQNIYGSDPRATAGEAVDRLAKAAF